MVEEKTLLKIKKLGDTGLLFLSLKEGPYGWTLTEEMQRTILDDLETHLRKFESEGHDESSKLTKKLIDDFSF